MAYISFQPSDFFSSKIYTGTGSSNAITGVGFQPDLTWIKNRDTTDSHVLTDVVRGVTKQIFSNSTEVEATQATNITSFDSDGFTLGTENQVNTNTEDFASWNWKAGTTTGIGSGDITPLSYSFNTTSGFSALTYTGTLSGSGIATVPHGLGIAPKMVLTKPLSHVRPWFVQHTSLTTPSYYLVLNTTTAQVNGVGNGTMSAPTSIVFDTNWGDGLNESGQTYIAYCFAEVKGYSKFGSYTGNTSTTDGPFGYCGFRPNFVMIKNIDDAEAWQLFDGKRAGYNAFNYRLYPNNNAVEAESTDYIDLLSNGFKIRTGSGGTSTHDVNSSGKLFIYAAFAEFPLVSSNDIPATAR